MPNRRSRFPLGGRIRARRTQLKLSVAEAARRVGVNRKTWFAWEKGAIPEDRNHRVIEDFCEWEPGSVLAVLDGRPPTPLRPEPGLASVTPLPSVAHSEPDDQVVSELRKMGRESGDVRYEAYIEGLIAAYQAEKADVQQRYRGIARRHADG